MTEIRKLTQHPYSQCSVIIKEDGAILFYSYSTLVIGAEPITEGHYEVYCTGTYSPTTRKQIGWFLKEYFGDLNYYHMKEIAGKHACKIAERKHSKLW